MKKKQVKEQPILNKCPADCPYKDETPSDEHCAKCIDKIIEEFDKIRSNNEI